VEAKHWHSHVHGNLDYPELLPKNADLRSLLDSLPMPKYIFTNADTIHAEVCLDQIGIRECFEDIISFDCIMDTIKPGPDVNMKEAIFCKPDLRSFEYALKRANAEAETTMFLDDSVANIKGAKAAGLQTVLVGNKQLCPGADHAIEDFLELKEAAPYLWK
jgi:pyrimidine 5'-nucleotidase